MRTACLCFVLAATMLAACGDNLGIGADSLSVSPSSVTIDIGDSTILTAAYEVNGTTVPATDVTWTSSNTATVTVSGNGASATLTGVATGSASITASGRGLTATTTVGVASNVTLMSIALTPSAPTIADGTTVLLTATGTFSDGSTADVTAAATWTSADDAVATVASGLVTGASPGDATITATVGTVSGTTLVTVTDATLLSLQVEPSDPSFPLGLDPQFTVLGTFSDTSVQDLTTQVTWASSDDTVATIDGAGLADTLAVGTTTISATLGAISDDSVLTVTDATLISIAVEPVDPSVPLGVDPAFTATGTYSDTSTQDLTDQVTWTSSDAAIATISDTVPTKGETETLAIGTTLITATFGAISDTSDLTVTDAVLVGIQITPVDPSVPLGIDPAFTATGTFSDASIQDLTDQVLWESTDESVATISNAAGSEGQATTLATGTTTMRATLGTVTDTSDLTVTDAVLVSIAVTPVDPTVPLGVDPSFTATGTYTDGTQLAITDAVTWASSDDTVATVSNLPGSEGQATTLTAGTTTISATSAAISGTSVLAVTAATLESIDVTPVDPTVPLGVDPQFVATGKYSDGSQSVITDAVLWESSDGAVATISNLPGSEGLASTATAGTTTISATQGAIVGTSDLSVTAAALVSIAVTPVNAARLTGETEQYTAIGTYSDSSTQDITTQVLWESSVTGIAQISNAAGSEGLATATGGGTTIITATQIPIVSNDATLVVSPRPTVIQTGPPDGFAGAQTTTAISVAFSEPMDPATLTGQTTNGACAGSIRLSSNNFASCIAFASATPFMNGTNTQATLTPAAALGNGVTYKIRVLGSAASAGSVPMGADFTQTTGFTTITGPCATTMVISQVYGGGGNSGAPFDADFVELHNPGPGTVDLTGMALQYGSSSGTTWSVIVLPVTGSVPAGGYFLVQMSAAGATGVPLTPDHVGSPAIAMSANNGKVALTSTATALVGACPTGGAILDVVGYGSANCAEVAPTPALGNTTAAIRNAGGCPDGNNLANFSVLAPAPRNAATTPFACECTATETDAAAELDFCNLQFPPTLTTTVGGPATDVCTRAFEAGVTETAGADPSVLAQIGVGPTGVNPATTPGWSWVNATFNVQVGNDDEYLRSLSPGPAGTFSYTSRFSRDAVNWTYCDLDGAGANAGLTFEPSMLGTMTVTP